MPGWGPEEEFKGLGDQGSVFVRDGAGLREGDVEAAAFGWEVGRREKDGDVQVVFPSAGAPLSAGLV